MICIDLWGYHHFGKLHFQPCIRPASVFGGHTTIKGHVFAVLEACQGAFVWVADRFSRRMYYSKFHHISEKATPAIKVVADAEKCCESRPWRFTCWVWHALPTGRPSIVHHSEWTLCTPLAGCGAWFSVFCPSFQLWTEAGNLGPTHCYAAMLSGWQWHNALRCSLGALGDGPSSWVAIVGHVRTGRAWTDKTIAWREGLFDPLYIFFFGFGAENLPAASEKLSQEKRYWWVHRVIFSFVGQWIGRKNMQGAMR